MAYRVEFAARAARDLKILYLAKNAAESQVAARLYSGLEEAIDALEANLGRCPVVPKARKLKRKVRHLLYGKKLHIDRVIYEVDKPLQTIWVLTIRHGARRKIRTSDLA